MTLAGPSPFDLSPIGNHLWQSTLCVAVAWLLTLTLRRNRAAVRYWVWLAASAKFLIPFAWLMSVGSWIGWRPVGAIAPAEFPLGFSLEEIGVPFAASAHTVPLAGAPAGDANILPAILLAVWLCGFGIACVNWARTWRRMRAVRRAAMPMDFDLAVPVLCSRERLEPGVFGIRKPILLLPLGITNRLTPRQMDAVLAHEMCHVRRRDNLTAAIHVMAGSIFWFHPLMWWMRERLVEERERACDEEVVRVASDPATYAESILNVCRFYLASPLVTVSGVTGADLKLRIEAILANRAADALSFGRKAALAGAALAAIAGPIAVGVLYVPSGQAQGGAQGKADAGQREFEAASIKVTQGGRTRSIDPVRITYLDTSLGEFIMMAYGLRRYQISAPDWVMNADRAGRYDLTATSGTPVTAAEMKRMIGPLLAERFHLTFHRESRELPVYAMVAAKGGVKVKQPGDDSAGGVAPDGEGGLAFKNYSMDDFAAWLSLLPVFGRPVIDRTGMKGSYTFHANLFDLPKDVSASDMKIAMGRSDGGDGNEVVFPALQEQLGLKLEAQKAPIDVLVLDHADKVPAEGSAHPAPLAFEVASVKVNKSGANPGGQFEISPGGESLIARNMAVASLAMKAFGVYQTQLTGSPQALALMREPAEHYDIDAKAAHSVSKSEMMRMLQTLLADRFHMSLHRETREVSGYALLVDAGGAKVREHAADGSDCAIHRQGDGTLKFENCTLDWLANNILFGALDNKFVANQTGLKGGYDFELLYSRELRANPSEGRPEATVVNPDAPSISTALKEQAGLRLQAQKVPVEMVVVDHVERPSGN